MAGALSFLMPKAGTAEAACGVPCIILAFGEQAAGVAAVVPGARIPAEGAAGLIPPPFNTPKSPVIRKPWALGLLKPSNPGGSGAVVWD